MPSIPVNTPSATNTPALKDRFFNFNQQEEVAEGEFQDVVPMDPHLDYSAPPDEVGKAVWQDSSYGPEDTSTKIDIGDDPLPQEAGFSIDLGGDTPTVFQDSNYASEKAAKFDFALGQDSPGHAKIQSDLELGQDNYLRESLAMKKSLSMQEDRIRHIRETLAEPRSTPFTQEEVDGIVYLSKAKPSVDPASVLEESYGQRFTEQTTQLPATASKFKEAMDQAPDDVLDGLDAVSSMVAKREMANDLFKDLEQRQKQQSTLGLVGDYAKGYLLPLYSYGNLTDQSGGAVDPLAARGANREANYEYFRTLNPSSFKKEFKAAYERIAESSLLDAQAFLEGYETYSNSDATLDNIFGYMDWAAVPGIAALSRTLLQGGINRGLRIRSENNKLTEAFTAQPSPSTLNAAPTAPQVPTPPKPDATFTVVPKASEGPKHTKFDPKTQTLEVDAEAVKAEWANKPWKKYGLDDSNFLLPDDWYNFWVERYKVSSFINRKDFTTKEDFAKAINEAALGSLKSGQKNQEAKGILKDTARAASQPTVEDSLSQVGETDLAASLLAHKRAKEVWDGKDPLGDSVDLKNRTVSLYYPHEFFDNPGSLSRKRAEDLKARALNSAAKLLGIPNNNAAIVRMTPEAQQAAIDVAKAQMARDYAHVNDAVLDVGLGGPFNVITPEELNVNNFVLEYRLGKITRKREEPKAPPPKPVEPPKAAPTTTGDEVLDNINKYTASNGRMLVRDLYDQMKRDGAYKGSLADFRQYVGKLNAEKKVTTSLFEGKIPAPAPSLRKKATLDEEGNFASNFKRDQNYGNETFRNRIIDSEYVYKKETQFTSARRFHYIEPSSTSNAAKAARPTPKPSVSYTPSNPTHLTGFLEAKSDVRGLEDSLTELLKITAKTPNKKLYDRIAKSIAKIESRRPTNRAPGEDIRGPGEQLNTSPYNHSSTSISKRRVKVGKDKEIDQIEVSDVDRSVQTNRSLTKNEKEAYARLEREVYQNEALYKSRRPTRTPRDEPYVVEKKLGKPSAELFKSEAQAANYGTRLYGLSPNQFKIRRQGGGYYISIPKVVDETVAQARDLMTTTGNKSDEGFANAFFGYILTPDGQLSQLANANRKLATYAPGEMHRIMQEAATEIRSLPRAEREELVEIWTLNRDVEVEDPETGKIDRGMFHRDVASLEKQFLSRHGKLPTDGQIAAYGEYVRLYDTDYVLRNLALHRDLGRLGLEKTRIFSHFDNDGQIDTQPSRWFSSREIDDLPYGDDGENWGLFIYDEQAKGGTFHLKSQLTKDIIDDIATKRSQHGYRLLELGNPLEKPLRSVIGNDETANFVLVKKFEKVKYDWAALPYNPGGHVAYDMKFFSKQPRIRRSDASGVKRNIYEGDTSMLAHDTEEEARTISAAMDKARIMLKSGTPDADLEDFLHRNTPYDLKEWKKLFEERTNNKTGETIPPKLHIDDPITYTHSGRNSFDMEHFKGTAQQYPNFVDAIRSKYNIFANGVDKKYLGARDPDLPAVEIGHGNTPVMTLTKPRLIDPIDTINSSLANAIRSKYLNDYKAFSVESFIQEFASVMKTPPDELRRNPVYYLHNPLWDTEVKGAGALKLSAAKNARRAIVNFLGTDSPLGEHLNWLQQKAVNEIYKNFGQDAATKVVSNKWLPFEKDPISFLRSVAFHSKLGLFNIKQYFTQAQSIVNVAAVEGWGSAFGAMPKAFAARRLALTESDDVIQGVVKTLGLQDTDFLESYRELKKTGFYNIGGETSARDDFFDPKVVSSPVGSFLEKGTVFFKEGERIGRLNAWFAAYSTWRDKNPGKIMTNSDRNLVLNRADTLMVNQSRASNAALQNGLGSLPTQFYSYQWRLAELMLGKRLSRGERLSAFLTHSAMYGIPVGLSAGVAVPFYDDFRQAAIERGVNMDDKQIQIFHDGLVSTGISVATGEQYNFSQTYGPAGLSVIKDVAEGNKSVIDLLIGVGGTNMIDSVKALGVGADALYSLFTFDPKDGPTTADLIDITKNVSSVNSALQAWMMYNFGRYVSKSGATIVNDTTATDAFMQMMFGLQKNEVGDTFRMIESMKEQKEYEDTIKKEVLKYYRQSLRSREDGDDKQADLALTKARAALITGGFRPDQMREIAQRAAQDNGTMFESMQKKFVKQAPPSQYQQRLDAAIDHNARNNKGY